MLGLALLGAAGIAAPTPASEIVEVGGEGDNCNQDPHCINRLHPAIPMTSRAPPGQTIVLHTRNASDFSLDPETPEDPRSGDAQFGTVHPLTGPVHIEGAKPGNVLAVRLLDIAPGPVAFTLITGSGLVSDVIPGPLRIRWRLDRDFAVSDDLPGVRIPNASFPGVVTVLPGPEQHAAMLAREEALAEAGGAVRRPHPLHASPAAVCGPGGSHEKQCLRTIPPREHGGNMDIRYLQSGVTIYLPCYIEGCGLAVGDLHYAQGDGEVAGTALEMDATVTLTVEILEDGPRLDRGPHYAGPARLLDIPSRRFYATTGFPLKGEGEVPPRDACLESTKLADLTNLSSDITTAARNALLAMIDHIVETYGYSREQAYLICSIAVDLRIGQVVDVPNVGVTAALPVDIFEGKDE